MANSHSYFVGKLGLLVHNNDACKAGKFIVDEKGNVLIEPQGGATVGSSDGAFIETRYPDGSPAQQYHSSHKNNPDPHGHGFDPSGEKNKRGISRDPLGNEVDVNSPAAHWPVKR